MTDRTPRADPAPAWGLGTAVSPPRGSPRRRAASRIVWLVAAGGLVPIGVLVWMSVTMAPSVALIDIVSSAALVFSLVSFLVSGAVIVSRRPGNIIGWLLMLPGLVLPSTELANRWLIALDPPPTQLSPGLWALLLLTGFSWVALIFPLFHILLTFPTGRLLSVRWRLAVALEIAMVVTILVIGAVTIRMGPFDGDDYAWTVPNPIGFLPADSLDGVFGAIWQAGLVALSILGIAAVLLRFRRGTADEREQMKWPLAGGVVFGLTYALSAVQSEVSGPLFLFGIAAIPISIAIAITRYRLYDIDRLFSRTVTYGLVTAVLAAAFLGTNLVLQAVLDRGTTFEVAVSTLVIAMLFQPLRRAIQRPIDRRFNRARVDSERMVAAFAARARDQMDLPTLAGELSFTARRAVQPTSTAIWIRGTGHGTTLVPETAP